MEAVFYLLAFMLARVSWGLGYAESSVQTGQRAASRHRRQQQESSQRLPSTKYETEEASDQLVNTVERSADIETNTFPLGVSGGHIHNAK